MLTSIDNRPVIMEDLPARNVRKVGPYTEDNTSEKSKKIRLTQEPDIVREDVTQPAPIVVSPYFELSTTASAPTNNLNTLNASSTTSSTPPAPTSAQKSVADASKPNLAETKKPRRTQVFQPFKFFGKALEVQHSEVMLIFDGIELHEYITRVEKCFCADDIDIEISWFNYIDNCVKMTRPDNPSLCTWFDENLDASMPWTTAKSLMVRHLGLQSVATTSAIESFLRPQSKDELFEPYRMRHSFVVGALIIMMKNDIYNTNFSAEHELINHFIDGAYCLCPYLLNAMRPYRDRPFETWKHFEEGLDVNRELIEDRELEERPKKIAEEEKAEKIAAKKARKLEKKRIKRNAKIMNAKIEQIRKENDALMKERREQGLCCFCGVTKHSYKHNLVCLAKTFYRENGRLMK